MVFMKKSLKCDKINEKIIIFALIIIHLCNGSRRLDKLFYAIKFSFQQHFPYQSSEYDTPLFIFIYNF